ncbi:hypothetical protein PHMEG_00016404 [Phytophthora megakarya]|uniref:Uncharacterized protein n=1 Tax=Phytophthora megakarya TaxID=4795 RepID=A0A225VZ34_9STRA|nr:hypothetical protein PHMEG_00016404 [Phytophthora megakarya]
MPYSIVEEGEIIHVHRQPRKQLLFYLQTEQAKVALTSQKCSFIGRAPRFDDLNPLSDVFLVDILGIRSDDVVSCIFAGFLLSGYQPVYYNFTYRVLDTAITSGIVRYYFNFLSCSSALVVNEYVCDEVTLDDVVFSARARGSQATQYHKNPGNVSHHVLHFGLSATSMEEPVVSPTGNRGENVTGTNYVSTH